MAETVYNRHKFEWFRADSDFLVDQYDALLLVGALTIDPDHVFVSNVLAANTEATDASYGRVTLGTKTVTQVDASDRAEADCADIDFTTLDNETPTAIVLFRFVTVDGDSPVMSLHDTNFGVASNGAGYVVETPNGVVYIT